MSYSTEKVEKNKLKNTFNNNLNPPLNKPGHTKNNSISLKINKNLPTKVNKELNSDEMINQRINRKKERASKSLKSEKNTNKEENSSVIFQSINSGQYTTNIHNNLNININTPNIPHNNKATPQLKRNIVSFGQINNNLGNNYIESMKNIFESKSILKLKEELLESKLKNEKLQNENNLLHEKMRTNKSMTNFYEQKIEMLKKHYGDTIEGYKKELEKMKKTNNSLGLGLKAHQRNESRVSNSVDTHKESVKNEKSENFHKLEEKFKQNESYLTSTLNILIDTIELFLFQKVPNTARDSYLKTNTDNISYSIDIYDSYNNDDERRSTLIEQIQSIVLSKLKFLSIVMNVNLDKEITKVKNWNSFINKDSNNNLSISLNNLSQVKNSMKKDQREMKEKDAQSFTSSDQNSSNIFQTSPKFYRNISFDSLKDNNDSKIRVFEIPKDENYSVRLNTSAQNDSLDFINEGQSYTSFQDINNNKAFNMISSFGNLNMNFDFNPKCNNDIENTMIFKDSLKDINGTIVKNDYNSGNTLGNNSNNNILNEIKIAEPEYIIVGSSAVSSGNNNTNILNNQPNQVPTQNIQILNILDQNLQKEENEKEKSENEPIPNPTFHMVEPKLKFTSTFKKLSIDLNDEQTEFNIQEICVASNNNNECDFNNDNNYFDTNLEIETNVENTETGNGNINISFTN